MATIFTVIQVYFYGKNVKLGAIFGIIGSGLWIIIGISTKMNGLLTLNAILLIMNSYNLYKVKVR